MNKLKEAQLSFIVDEATKMFFTRSINDVTMTDIAKELGIGEATLYRYFGKKSNIVLLAAERLSKKVLDEYFVIDETLSGFERIKKFFESYLDIFNKTRGYYTFVSSFDTFIATEKNIDLSSYSSIVCEYKKVFDSAYDAGIKDGTIKYDGDKDIYYRSTSLSLLSLCKKLADEDDLLEEDKKFDASNEIKALIEIYLYRIK